MKTMKCYDCEEQLNAATSEEMLQHFYNHYMELHTEIITGADEAEKKRWMEQYKLDWAVAPTQD